MEWLRGAGSMALLAVSLTACSSSSSDGEEQEAQTLSGVTAISAGLLYNCALIQDGTVRCWGTDVSEKRRESRLRSWSADAVPRVTDAVAVSAGYTHACAALSDGSVKCW